MNIVIKEIFNSLKNRPASYSVIALIFLSLPTIIPILPESFRPTVYIVSIVLIMFAIIVIQIIDTKNAINYGAQITEGLSPDALSELISNAKKHIYTSN